MFNGMELAMIDAAGHNGIRDEHIEKIAREIRETGYTTITREIFEHICRRCFIDPDNFNQEDLDRLQQRLNQY